MGKNVVVVDDVTADGLGDRVCRNTFCCVRFDEDEVVAAPWTSSVCWGSTLAMGSTVVVVTLALRVTSWPVDGLAAEPAATRDVMESGTTVPDTGMLGPPMICWTVDSGMEVSETHVQL